MNFEPLETRTFLSMSPAVALMQPHVSVEPHPQVRMSSTSISYVGAGIGQSQQPNVTSNSFSIPIIGITAVRGSIVYITIERINLPRISLPPGNFDYPHMIDSHQGWPQPGQWAPPPPPPGPVVTPPTGTEVPIVSDDPAPARSSARALRVSPAVQTASADVVVRTIHSSNLPLATNVIRLVQEVEANVMTIPQAAVGKASAAIGQLQSALLSAMTAHNIAWRGIDALAAPAAEAQAPAPEAGIAGFAQKLAAAVKSAKHFDFATLTDPLTLLTDPIAAFVDESLSLGKSVASIGVQSSGAWSVTAAVIAADVVLLTYLYRRDQRGRQRRKLQPAWSVQPQVFND